MVVKTFVTFVRLGFFVKHHVPFVKSNLQETISLYYSISQQNLITTSQRVLIENYFHTDSDQDIDSLVVSRLNRMRPVTNFASRPSLLEKRCLSSSVVRAVVRKATVKQTEVVTG